jgi:hypothetical protein
MRPPSRLRLLSRCQGCCRDVEAAVEVSKPWSRGQRRVEVEAAVEVLRLLSRCQGCCRGIEAAIKVEAAVEVLGPPLRCSRLLSKCRGRHQGAVDIEAVMLSIAPESSTTCVNFGLCAEEKELSSRSGL